MNNQLLHFQIVFKNASGKVALCCGECATDARKAIKLAQKAVKEDQKNGLNMEAVIDTAEAYFFPGTVYGVYK